MPTRHLLHSIGRGLVPLTYLALLLVQLNIHLGDPPAVSYFSSDTASVRTAPSDGPAIAKSPKENRKYVFRLNKRFQPEQVFLVPASQILIAPPVAEQSPVLFELPARVSDRPALAPSLRGPPAACLS